MRAFPTRFLKDDGGATAIEYGLIAAIVAIIAIGALITFGQTGSGIFNSAMNAISAAISGSETS